MTPSVKPPKSPLGREVHFTSNRKPKNGIAGFGLQTELIYKWGLQTRETYPPAGHGSSFLPSPRGREVHFTSNRKPKNGNAGFGLQTELIYKWGLQTRETDPLSKKSKSDTVVPFFLSFFEKVSIFAIKKGYGKRQVSPRS